MKFKFYSLIIIVFVLINTKSFSQAIKGKVYDAVSKEQLVGAEITVTPINKKHVSTVDGGFNFKNVADGKYRVRISYIGYKTFDTTITLEDSKTINLNCYIRPVVADISEVTVSSYGNGNSDKYAIRKEQLAPSIMNIVSANAISISPDVTVANVMQRMSGVSIDRNNSGEGQHVIIRGMDKKYNTTLINGVKIPSPDPKNRYIPLDIFPADMVDRIEVVKSLTPDMEGDASGGVVNLVMKNAPDKLKVDGGFGTGYSTIFMDHPFTSYSTSGINKQSPYERMGGIGISSNQIPYYFPVNNLLTSQINRPINKNANLTVGNRFLNNKLGVLIAGSYQNDYKGSTSNVLVQDLTIRAAPDVNSLSVLTCEQYDVRKYSSRTDRSGIETKIDYNLNPTNSFSLFATYIQLNEDRVRLSADTGVSTNGSNVNNNGNYSIAKTASYKTQIRTDLQSILNSTLQGKHKLLDNHLFSLNTDWSLAYSLAKKEMPNMATYGYSETVKNTSIPYIVTTPGVDNESREWMHNTDKDLSGYLNFNLKTDIEGKAAIFTFGGMYRHKERNNFDCKYSLIAPDQAPYSTIQNARFQWDVTDASIKDSGDAATSAGVYTATENITAGYIQGKYNFLKQLEITGGVRIENTYQNYISQLDVWKDGKTATISYLDFLPSIQGKYSLDEKQAIRASYFRSILRPNFADLIPSVNNIVNDTYDTKGNPHIQHTVIDNFDLRYEMFPKGLDQVMLGAFYKIITNPIEYGFTKYGSTASDFDLEPHNYGTAHNAGFELVFRKYFGNFGISGNYTFTDSRITTTKIFYYNLPNDRDTTIPDYKERRPLTGQSKHIANFSFLYKDTKNKIDAQLALVYTGERLNTTTLYKGLDDYERATTNMDFSIQKGFHKHYIIYAKANNLLNTPFQMIVKEPNVYLHGTNGYKTLPFQRDTNYVTVEYDKFYASYSLGFRFKF